MEEYIFNCPCCWQEISMLLDLSVPEQTYTEDCEVCCRPLVIHFQVVDEKPANFYASFQE